MYVIQIQPSLFQLWSDYCRLWIQRWMYRLSTKTSTIWIKDDSLTNKENAFIVWDFYNYMKEKGSSENSIINNLKVILDYVNYLGSTK